MYIMYTLPEVRCYAGLDEMGLLHEGTRDHELARLAGEAFVELFQNR